MRVTDSLMKGNREKLTKKKPYEDEQLEMYAVRSRHDWFGADSADNVMSVTKLAGGINTDKSVFDRQAVFKTGGA